VLLSCLTRRFWLLSKMIESREDNSRKKDDLQVLALRIIDTAHSNLIKAFNKGNPEEYCTALNNYFIGETIASENGINTDIYNNRTKAMEKQFAEITREYFS
jgi:hypothetical protein